tara:strand:- start:105 stop:824 length:720 start_codon:yes stop_codon:yes gene_type:complete
MSPCEFQPLTVEIDSSNTIEEDIEEGLRDGKGVQSPRVILPRNKKKNIRVCLVIFVLLIATTYAWYILSNNGDGAEMGQHSHLEASAGGAWPHRHLSIYVRRHPHCGEDGVECCYIYGQYHDYPLDPKRIVKRDESGSNCPSLLTLVNNYNEYNKKSSGNVNCSKTECCSVDISRDELIRHNVTVEGSTVFLPVSKETHDVCPSVKTIIMAYEDYYNGDADGIAIILLILIIFGVIAAA